MGTFSHNQTESKIVSVRSSIETTEPLTKRVYVLLTLNEYEMIQARIEEERDVQDMYPLLAEIEI
jgi:hypothetical protein